MTPTFTPARYTPYFKATLDFIPRQYGYLQQEPVILPVVADAINAGGNAFVDSGRYLETANSIVGPATPKTQDMYLTSDPDVTSGLQWDADSGDWHNLLLPETDSNALLQQDNTAGTAWSLTEHNDLGSIQNRDITLYRGDPPIASTPSQSNCFTLIELSHGSTINYRIALKYTLPPSLDVTYDGGTTWKVVQQARDLPATETLLKRNGGRIHLRVNVDRARSLLTVEINDGNVLSHQPQNQTGDMKNWLPTSGLMRVSGQNGTCIVSALLLRFGTMQITTAPYDAGTPLLNGAMAYVAHNALTPYDANQTTTSYVKDSASGAAATSGTQNFYFTTTARKPDAGDSLGSADAPGLTDGLLVVPGKWGVKINDANADYPPAQQQQGVLLHYQSVWNDVARCATLTGFLTCNATSAHYANAKGHYALALVGGDSYHAPSSGYGTGGVSGGATSLGGSAVSGASGLWNLGALIAGADATGWSLQRRDPSQNFATVSISDKSVVMSYPTGVERLHDGKCLWSAVREECELGNISPVWLAHLPDAAGTGIYYPPGAPTTSVGGGAVIPTNGHAPYGRAGATCPYPILGSGTGPNPRYRFGPEISAWQALQILCSEQGELVSVGGVMRNLPYYMGFDAFGYFRMAVYNPFIAPIVCAFSSDPLNSVLNDSGYNVVNPSNSSDTISMTNVPLFKITSGLMVNATSDPLRTDVRFQTLDGMTYELLTYAKVADNAVQEQVGFRKRWVERSARWGDKATLKTLLDVSLQKSAISPLVVQIDCAWYAGLGAGGIIVVEDPLYLPTPTKFYVTHMEVCAGVTPDGADGKSQCSMSLLARSVESY